MKRKIKLRVEDLEVASFGVESGGGVHAASYTIHYETCECMISHIQCVSYTGMCPGGPACVTQEYGGGEGCVTGPQAYC